MRNYYRVMLGKGSMYASDCLAGSFIGVDFLANVNLTGSLPDDWRAFNKKYIPVWLEDFPEKSKVAAGLACGALWTVSKGIQQGDIVLCPDGSGNYHIGEVKGDYEYVAGGPLPHRRAVQWWPQTIERSSMPESVKRAAGSIGTVCNLQDYAEEVEALLGDVSQPSVLLSNDETIESPMAFALEKHLEDFLCANWSQTKLGEAYDIFEEEPGDQAGKQYQCDTGAIDILAMGKDRQRLLVVELKKGRASDVVVGQILRYMGFVQDVLAEEGQTVEGVIIALEDDLKIRRALAVVPSIRFYRYQVKFELLEV